MLIGIGLPTRTTGAHAGDLLDWAARADQGPFSSLAVMDRVAFQAYEPLIALAAAVGVTRRIRLMTSILLAPTRETTLLARQAASIDLLSGGRLSLGIGIGARDEDYRATGYAFSSRGRREEEQLATLRRVWAGAPLRDGLGAIGPAPFRPGGPEVLVGGYVAAIARRIAQWGDGFMAPGGGEPARMVELWGQIQAAWAEAGREGRPRWVSGSYCALGPNAERDARSYIHVWYGADPTLEERRLRGIPTTPQAVRDAIARQADMGVDEFILRPCSGAPELLDRLADLVG